MLSQQLVASFMTTRINGLPVLLVINSKLNSNQIYMCKYFSYYEYFPVQSLSLPG
ncbi:hypothetical protein OIU84_023047 [Salix udensis]|uniref:Uncharacterized protein n=1 Tax=Salix udensis TaxID=889485 RepID=A0AAD6KQE0_9ROSI|nr:hypothetical protein OIU84_023047 [Salix udensis]